MISSTGKRIKEKRNKLGLTLANLADKLNVSEATVQRYESGKIKTIKYDILTALSEILNTTPSYLLGYESQTIEENKEFFSPITDFEETSFDNLRFFNNPRSSALVFNDNKATYNSDYDYEFEEEEEPEEIADLCMVMNDDSMSDIRINKGDTVYIKKQLAVTHGEIAALILDKKVTLKRVFLYQDRIELHPENKYYQPITLPKSPKIKLQIIGRAIAFRSLIK